MAVVATDESEKDHVEAERFVEEEGVWRHPTGFSRFVVPAVAVAWSLFQLAIACNLSIPRATQVLAPRPLRAQVTADHPYRRSGRR